VLSPAGASKRMSGSCRYEYENAGKAREGEMRLMSRGRVSGTETKETAACLLLVVDMLKEGLNVIDVCSMIRLESAV